MSKLAKYLINKEKKQKTTFLDLGNCKLTDLVAEIPELFELVWLETLVLSNGYEDLRTQQKHENANAEAPNNINQLPIELKSLTKLKALYVGSFEVYQETEEYWHILPVENALEGLELIQHFKHLEILDCRYRGIISLKFLKDLPKLQYLNLGHNRINDLQHLDGLLELKSLILKNNAIQHITEVYNLPKLEYLDVSNNQLVDTRGLATFDTLTFLNLSHNRINDLKGIQNLLALEQLDLSHNELHLVFRLAQLLALKKLNLNDNRIEDVQCLRKLNNLRHLNLSRTRMIDLDWLVNLSNLESLEFEENEVIDVQLFFKLINLQILNLAKNHIETIEGIENLDSIVQLNLAQNRLRDIMPLVPLLKKGMKVELSYHDEMEAPIYQKQQSLPSINLFENPIENPPFEILQQGTPAILDFFAEGQITEITSDDFYEVKILIIGEGGAGKTTLFRKLRYSNSPLPTETDSTMGIEIHQLNFKTRHDKNVRANIWDFGGQEIYHATHQFFFSKRALYILVDDTRINNDTTVNDKSFSYWFSLVDLLGGDSPLLIVQNEKSDRSKQLEVNSMRGRFGFIKEVLQTNLQTGRGLPDIHNAIENQVQNLLNTNISLPMTWIDIRKKIEVLAKENQEIGAGQWRAICKEHGIHELKRQKSLSQYFHDVGVFLHFQDDALLRKSVILQKEWATAAVYRVLDDETIKDHGGQFDETDLSRLWKKDNLSEYQNEFLALMLKFELCFELPDRPVKRWLAPQLLPKEQAQYDWSGTDSKELHFKYDFLPSGLINRLIVRLNRFIVRTDLAWRSGVILERLGAQAEVMEVLDNTIRIRVRGDNQSFRKELLTIIIDEFDQLHKKFTGLKLNKWVACNCTLCSQSNTPQLFKYTALLSRKKDGKTTKECDRSYEQISVNDLLDEAKTVRSTIHSKAKTSSKKGKLKLLIANNETRKTLKLLKEELPEENLVLMVESQWKQLRHDELAGILSLNETSTFRSKITKKLLMLVDKIKS